ncbi:MAG TPA: hypothetical protein VFG77_04290 [Nitrososphaeraceae archaeon]|nr:hypothetical protein [Nitrososphaeraceae archaeon]
MSHRKQKYTIALFAILGFFLSSIVIVSSGGTSFFMTVTGQQVGVDQQNTINFTNVGNNTSILSDPTQNQTNQTGTAALSANLTQSDFDILRQDLTEAHQALEVNDTTTLLDELSSASGELFQITSRQFDPDHVEAMTQDFNPLQTHIDGAQEAALKDNHTGTMKELSAAESELLTIIQMLPSGQE